MVSIANINGEVSNTNEIFVLIQLNQIPVVILEWIFSKCSLLVRLFKQISKYKFLRASLGGSFSWQSAYISKSQNFANHLWMYSTYALLFQWPGKREVSINVPSDAAQSVPYVLYSSSPQKLQFEFEKNLKIMLTICIPQKHFSCLSTFSWLSRGSRKEFPSSTSNFFCWVLRHIQVFSLPNPIQFVNCTVPSFIIYQ